MRGRWGHGVQRRLHHPLDHLGADGLASPRTWGVLEDARHSRLSKPPSPQDHRGPGHRQPAGNGVVGQARSGQKYDVGTQGRFPWRLARIGQMFQTLVLVLIDAEGFSGSEHATIIPPTTSLSSYFWDDTLEAV